MTKRTFKKGQRIAAFVTFWDNDLPDSLRQLAVGIITSVKGNILTVDWKCVRVYEHPFFRVAPKNPRCQWYKPQRGELNKKINIDAVEFTNIPSYVPKVVKKG